MTTPYDKGNASFSERAHLAAQRQVYPGWFREPVTFEDCVGTKRDLAYAIDRQLAVTVPDLRAPLRLSVQERFRRPRYQGWGDITITEWNLISGQPSELHKLAAQLFVYGFYDPTADVILEARAFNVARILIAISNGEVHWDREQRAGRDQSFISLQIRDLVKIGAEVFAYTNDSEAVA